ncbi:MAG TPA: hypothetical protein DHW82_05870, partial [Spirochaetia bacterium]|nr:hypothetical protein [Spirochaetia bacterium]
MEKKGIRHYKFIEKIAEGGMGIVYQALDEKSGQKVAVKTLKTSIDIYNEAFIRFKKEADVLQKLSHPNVLKFIDFIEDDGKVYIVTEFLDGKNLKYHIKEKNFNLNQKVEIIQKIAATLDYVHSQGIIHRDMKSSNVILVGEREPKILDFGLANLMNFQKIFGQSDNIAGSFAYMSPEQSGILKRNIDNRSDLYSLGILFYELMTGELPYQAKEIGELIHQHIAKIPVEPGKIIQNLPSLINAIILKLMKKDPDDRYQTAFGLSEDLRKYLLSPEKEKISFELGKKDKLKNLNYSPVLVGRKNEIKQIQEKVKALAKEKGFLDVVIGKSGMGKSRLVNEAQKAASLEKCIFISCRSEEKDAHSPFQPFIEAVRKLIDIYEKMPKKMKEPIYSCIREKLGKEGQILVRLIPQLEILLGKDEKQKFENEEDLLFLKLKELLQSFSSKKLPLILAFEDIDHWDEASLLFLDYFLPAINEKGLFLILSCREEKIQSLKKIYEHFIHMAKENHAAILNLRPMNDEELQNWIVEIFDLSRTGLNVLASRLNETAQGNPLLILENIKTLVEENVIVQKNDEWVLDQEKLTTFQFSSSLIDKYLNRIKKCSESVLTTLKFASILGKNFDFEMLYSIHTSKDKKMKMELLLENLQEALKDELINENLTERGEIYYSFNHEKVIDALLSRLEKDKIRELHKTAAAVFEKDYKKSDRVYQLAYHYLKAGIDKKAYQYNYEAGKKSELSYSFKSALNFYQNAYQILEKMKSSSKDHIESKIVIALDIAKINFQMGELKANIELLEKILPEAKKIENQEAVVKILYFLGKNHYFLGDQQKAMQFYYQVIPLAESLNLPEFLGIPYAALGRAFCYIAHFKEAVQYIEKGLPMLPENEKLELIYSLGILAQSFSALGEKKKAFDTIEKLKKKFASEKDILFQLYLQFFEASVMSMVGNPKQAMIESEKVYEMAKELKNPSIEINALFSISRSFAWQGKFDEALKYGSRGIELAKEYNLMFGLFMILFNQAEILAMTGNIAKAKKTYEESLQWVGISNPNLVDHFKNRLSAVFEVYSLEPDFNKALQFVEEATRKAESLGEEYELFAAYSYLSKAGLFWRMERYDEAQIFYEKGVEILKKKDLQNDLEAAKILKQRFGTKNDFTHTHSESHFRSDYSVTFTQSANQTEFSYHRQLKYLLKLAEQLSQVYELESLFPKIMALAIEVSGAERCILFLYESQKRRKTDEKKLVVKAWKSIDPEEENSEIGYSEMILEKTLKSGRGVLVIDAQDELKEDESVFRLNMKSVITVPLAMSGKILGAIYLDNRQVKGLFTEENFELLKAFAIEAAISIENARLYQEVQKKAMALQEMQIAKDIQTSILPTIKEIPEYEISAFMRTATEVGGDYYDFYLDEAPFFAVFGDVSGHGLKSGLIMMMAEVAFNTIMTDKTMREKDIDVLYQAINTALYKNIQERLTRKSKMGDQYSYMYMTFRICRFDREGNLEMFGNDHAEPFIVRAKDGKKEKIESSGFLLGM